MHASSPTRLSHANEAWSIEGVKRLLVCAMAIVGSASWAFASGCGGSVATVGDGGVGDDASVSDSSVTHDSAVLVDSAPVDCTALSAKVDKLRADALTCCPFCNSIQCSVAVEDVCCPISITAPSAPEFSMAVAQLKASCPQACPATPCRKAPSGICTSVDPQNPSARGVCQ